jgi:spermidine/putrescine transport system substrate-binding protein
MTSDVTRRQFVARSVAVAATTTLGGSLLAACGAGSSSGTLSTLMWEDYATKGVVGAFERRKGITIDNSPLGTNDEILTKLRAGGSGSTSVASPGIAFVPAQIEAGVLEPLDLARIPNVRNYFPAFAAQLREKLTVDGKTYGIPVAWGLDTMVYNQTRIPEPPRSWMDVLKPEYKGKVLLVEGPQANFEIWPRVIGGWDPARLTRDQLDKTTDFLIRLKRTQVRSIASSNDDIARMFAAGEVWITASGSNPATQPVAERLGGDRVRFTIPKEGAATWCDSLAIPKSPPNADAAYAFLNYMLEPRPQAEHAREFYAGVVVRAAVPLVGDENRSIVPYDQIDRLTKQAPVFTFPPSSGYTTPSDWNDAWARIAAA